MLDLSLPDHLPIHKPLTYEEHTLPNNQEKQFLFKPTEGDLNKFALDLKKHYPQQITWQDFAPLVMQSLCYLEKFFDLNLIEKRQHILYIMHYFVLAKDKNHLPDQFSTNIFYPMIIAFIDMVVPNNVEEFLSKLTYDKPPMATDIINYGQSIKTSFSDGFQWKDFATSTRLAIRYAARYKKLQSTEKKAIANQIVDYIVESTDSYFLPPYVTDKILKAIAHSYIDQLFDILSN